ncbi:MAG: putative ABC transporter ATP-binding protein [Firmicutes bacterium]|nr:putative ABC transporter ATP-binding protein [candidate division NPL-UPA2 bacterium]
MSNIYDLDLDEQKERRVRSFNRHYLKRMLGYLRPYSGKVILVVGFMTAATLGHLAEPLLFRYIIDNAIENKDIWRLHQLIPVFLGLRAVLWVLARYQTNLLNWTGQHVLFDLRQHLFSHIQRLSFDFYDGRPVGKIMSRVTSDVNTMTQFTNNGVVTIVTQLLNLFGITAILLRLNWRLSLLCIGLMPLLGFFMARVHPFFQSGWLKVREENAKVIAHLNESITGIQVIQTFSRQTVNSTRFAAILSGKVEAFLRVIKMEVLFWPIIENVAAVGTALVIWYGAQEFISGALTVGTLWAFITYLNRFWQPLSAVSRVYSQMLSAMAGAERVFGFLDTAPRIDDTAACGDLPEIIGRVEFKNVSFGYQAGQQVLSDVSFAAEPGQTIALVGPTGAGKSTIINLVARFYDPSAGEVIVDGHDLRHVRLESFRSQLGIVLQDPFIFAGTIGDNVAYGKLAATQTEIQVACKAVGAHGFIEKLPQGYDTESQERGNAFSQGQKQLLAFARALIADPRILILDEATASIDTETERVIQQALAELLKGRTSFVIAHRLSTIRNADVILVIESGRIAERGNHDELMMLRGKYYDLYTTQHRHLCDMLERG